MDFTVWRHCGLAVFAALCLCSCKATEDIPFLSHTNYKITGVEDNKDVDSYLHTLLDNRLAEKTVEAEGDDKVRQEHYRRQMIASDLTAGLQAKGYYEGKVTYKRGEDDEDGSFIIDAGPLYHWSKVSLEPDDFQVYVDKIIARPGDAMGAQPVIDSEQALLLALSQDHCYFNLDVTHTATLNAEQKTGAIVFHVTAGRDAKFGPVDFEGQTSIKESYLRKLITWKEGDCYRQDKIEAFRAALLESGLFSKAEAQLPPAPMADGSVPVTINLTECAHRTLKAGMSYYTDEGIGATFGWEHRNLFGAAEKLTTDLSVSQRKQSLDLDLTKPYFLRKDQSLSFTNAYRHQDTDAYKETAIDAGVALNRKINRFLNASTGAKFTLSRIDDQTGVTNSYGLLSLPQNLGYDNRDSKLDPHKGWLINAGTAPYFDMLGNSNPFLKAQLTASTYFSLGTPADLVLAVRGNVGSIMGTTTDDVPATERFYSGGGGSVRGFGYQEIGPFKNGKATGGRSVAESSAELRFKLTDKIGAVTFVDAGSVSDQAFPDLDSLSVGTGVGLRYYTAFGPLRFDVGVPLNGKSQTDQKYQIYISIGQAF